MSEHNLLVCDLDLNTSLCKTKALPPKRKLWKLKSPEVSELFKNSVCDSAQSFKHPQDVDKAWVEIKSSLLTASDSA